MVRSFSALAALLMLAVCAIPAFAAKPKGTEFKDGWNTFATAKEGDWIEYQIGDNMSRRVEVKVVAGEKITVAEAVTIDGKAGEPKEKKPSEWWLMKLPA